MKLRTLPPVVRAVKSNYVSLPPKETERHYGTAAHREWALAVKRRAGWRCQWPGCTAKHPERLYADHVVEIKDGGAALDPSNGMALCAKHHTVKTVREKRARQANQET